ncbi:glycosyltransferase family 4 protein [Bosea sp. BK604]|uniref:glycosyltransferase family 4 protein n=1 Tax=Bosea sp. BK604 TaxID=2512180 RepID=UPI00104F06E6|nr:glycosyltransferase family 4 protein [Bosea sp. BK604]TCR61528.1 glycosyltransferase involved in cell wall biosynthesis [Bosea sp. BK604]
MNPDPRARALEHPAPVRRVQPMSQGSAMPGAVDRNRERPAGRPEPVAVLIGQLSQGGSERQLFMFLTHCDRTRWAPVVYVSGELGFWEEQISALGIPIRLLTGSRLAKMYQFRAACAAQGARYFFSWSSYTNPFGLALLGMDVWRIGSFRNAQFADLPAFLRSAWAWASLSAVSLAVCNSQETYDEIALRKAERPRLVYVPNGVEPPTNDEIAVWRATWRARLGIGDDVVLVVGVGRLARQKRFDRFIQVIERVRKNVPVVAVVAGKDFGSLQDLERQVAQSDLNGVLRFIGTVPDARELISAGDILLLSSDHEGMSNVVLEAMSASVPPVVTRVNAVADLIEQGKTGFIADHDADDLARHVVRLARDCGLRRDIGERARSAVMLRYGSRAIAHQLWALCDVRNNGA